VSFVINPYRFAAVGPTVLVLDTFTASNGTNITARSPDINTAGGGWTAHSFGYAITTNRAVTTAGSMQGSLASVNAGAAAVRVSADIIMNTQGQGLGMNVTDVNNLWIAWMDGNAKTLDLYEMTAGAATKRAGTARTQVAGDAFTIAVERVGNTITVTEGANVISYASATAHASVTRHGIRTNSTGGSHDNFTVTA
jgi:hypothetical protein